MRKLLGTIAAVLAITAAMATTMVSAGPHDRHLYPNTLGKAPLQTGGWPDGTQANSNI